MLRRSRCAHVRLGAASGIPRGTLRCRRRANKRLLGEVDRLAVKTRPSDARPAFTCAAAAADFPFPVHPHMPTHACGVPSQNQHKTQPKLVIVFRRAILALTHF